MAVDPVARIDLDTCASEPIRIPGGIQPHGALIVSDSQASSVLQSSTNARALLGITLRPAMPLSEILSGAMAQHVKDWLEGSEPLFLRTAQIGAREFQLSGHRTSQGVLLEFEPGPADDRETLEAVYPRLRAFVDAIGATHTVQDIADIAVRELKELTGFNRVMLYSFDQTGDGTVLAECGDGVLPSYLDLRFPSADIPSQARELYRSNRLRLIPDANYIPSPIEPAMSPVDGKPLDLSAAALRSVSPIHLEYMRNMATLASMSISVLVDGRLWGLISCHNATPKLLNAQIRSACDFLGQIVSMQIGARERAGRAARRIQLKRVEGELLARMSRTADFHAGADASGDAWLRVVPADGVAIISNDGLTMLGMTPSEPELRELAPWLQRKFPGEIFETDCLSAHWPQAEAFAGVASGLLSVSISQLHPSYIMWFRQEVVRTVRWGGDPRKDPGANRLHPRKSFEIWKEQVRNKSLAWNEVEIEGARDLRNSIINFVLRRAEERAALSEQLQKTNAELEAFSYSVSHDLRAPFRHIVGYSELLSSKEKNLDEKSRHYVNSIVESALHAGRLVDDLLAFSQVGRVSLAANRIDMRKIVAEVRRGLDAEVAGRQIEWRIGDLPPACGDAALIRQVWANLMENAIKYTGNRDKAIIAIDGADEGEDRVRFSITDNGVGFEMNYVGKLFGVFQRLHRAEHFVGTGIGLALVKRIVERHGGSVAARGEVDKGASISFSLPKNPKGTDDGRA
jgi:two-component system, chemotaxis family, sensor kinase Cph1